MTVENSRPTNKMQTRPNYTSEKASPKLVPPTTKKAKTIPKKRRKHTQPHRGRILHEQTNAHPPQQNSNAKLTTQKAARN